MALAETIYVTVSGKKQKNVTCEQCHSKFYYILERGVVDTGTTSVLSALNPNVRTAGGVEKILEKRANKKLELVLKSVVDPVSCPKCQHLQTNMLGSYKHLVTKKFGGYDAIAGVSIISFFVFVIFFIIAIFIAGFEKLTIILFSLSLFTLISWKLSFYISNKKYKKIVDERALDIPIGIPH